MIFKISGFSFSFSNAFRNKTNLSALSGCSMTHDFVTRFRSFLILSVVNSFLERSELSRKTEFLISTINIFIRLFFPSSSQASHTCARHCLNRINHGEGFNSVDYFPETGWKDLDEKRVIIPQIEKDGSAPAHTSYFHLTRTLPWKIPQLTRPDPSAKLTFIRPNRWCDVEQNVQSGFSHLKSLETLGWIRPGFWSRLPMLWNIHPILASLVRNSAVFWPGIISSLGLGTLETNKTCWNVRWCGFIFTIRLILNAAL